ncbi:MAG: hypothetical protein KBA66_22270 [Leptospiraceae bacterium]|nr:hypothetical protein [Leptospiraceae bacterium]
MAKTFIYIFSFLGATYIIPDSISKRELSELRQVCIESYRNKNYKEAIPSLEKYLSFKNEIEFKLYLAKSILFRKDLISPEEEDEIFLRNDKKTTIQKNYNKSAKIFSEVVMYLEEVTPKDKRIADLYFLWAFAEYFGENREKAISLFSKSTRLKPELKKMANYNIAAIYEELGQIKDSEIYFKKQ